MLLFKPYHIPMVQDGRKDVSRRMWGDKARVVAGSYHQAKKQIFTKEHFGYLHINELYREPLLDITEDHARREGGYSRDEYIDLFHEIYPDAGDNPEPWVLEFKYVGMEKP